MKKLFGKIGKLTERSLGVLEGVDKSIYHPNCWFCVVVVVWFVLLFVVWTVQGVFW